MTDFWDRSGEEPALRDVLADPIVHLVMKRDGLTPEGVGLFLEAQKRRLFPILRKSSLAVQEEAVWTCAEEQRRAS